MVTFELGNGIKILHVFLYRHKRETKRKNRGFTFVIAIKIIWFPPFKNLNKILKIPLSLQLRVAYQ